MKNAIISLGLFTFTINSIIAANPDRPLYKAAIQPIMSAKCVSCHGEKKKKGKLRLDTLAAMLKGGSEGTSVVPGDPEGSSLMERIHLPLDDDDHMPPENKTQLTEEEISVLEFWIKNGAKEEATIASLNAPADIEKAITAVIASAAKAAPAATQNALPTKLSEADNKLIAATIEAVNEKGGNLMVIAQDTPQLRFSALNVSKTFGDDDLKLLKPVADHILWLDLGKTQITDEGLAVLGSMKNLTRLKLENTKISDQALEHVKDLSNLEYLNLYGTKVTDQGIAKLSENKNLKKLYLWQTKTTGKGVSALSKAIPGIYINSGAKMFIASPKKAPEKTKPEAKPEKAKPEALKAQTPYPDLPDLAALDSSVGEIGKKRKITNLLLLFLDFHISNEAYATLKEGGFKHSNLPTTIADLKHYGYEVIMPETADEYRANVYPALMDAHAKAGYYGVQIPVGAVAADDDGILTEAAIKLLKQQKQIVEGAGLSISAVGGMWVPDWKKCVKPQIQAANVLGSKYMYGPFATPFLQFPEDVAAGGDSAEWARNQVKTFAKLLQDEIGPFAAKHGVILCEEPLQRFERMPIHLKEAASLANQANIDQFKVMVDMCHEAADGGGPTVYKELIDQLFKAGKFHGVHVSPIHRGKLYNSWFNEEYFKDFFTPIFANGYEGEISIETFDAITPVVIPAKLNRDPFKNPVGVMINQLVYTTEMLKQFEK